MKVAVIGTGYVGLVTGVVLADLGNDVICVDNDQAKLAKLRNGEPTIYEPELEELIQSGIRQGFLSFSDSIKASVEASEVVFIAVGTPPGPDGTPDLRFVKEVASEIAKGINGPKVIVNKSTVPVGTGDFVRNLIVSQGVPGDQIEVVSNPEFLREGSAIHDTLHPDRVVIGAANREAAAKLEELYAPLNCPMIITDVASAELIKYGANSFLAMKISFINAMSRLCEITGANIGDVARGIGTDTRIGSQFLQAGLGYGGSCFPKDVQGLIKTSERLGYKFKLLNEVEEINQTQTSHFINRLEQRLGGFQGKTIGLLGLAFKPNTDDIRDAKSLIILEHILGAGGKVKAYDPAAADHVLARFPQMEKAENVYDVSEGADALILVTEWNEFHSLDFERLGAKMKSKILFDGRRIYSRPVIERSGFEYATIGS